MAGKKYQKAKEEVGVELSQSLEEALGRVNKAKYANFDETLEVALRLGVNPKHADQMVRGTVVLPHGLGVKRRVCVVASGEKMKEADDKRAQRKEERSERDPSLSDEDPDLAGIIPGPQPPLEDDF